MKYIHSSKFKAISVAMVTLVAVATATPGAATPHHEVTDTTGPMVTDTTGSMTDTTGPKVTDTSGTSLEKGTKPELKVYANGANLAKAQALLAQLKSAKTPAEYNTTLVQLKLVAVALRRSSGFSIRNSGW